MGYPDYSLPLHLHTDACKSGFARISTQEQPGGRVIVDAVSRATNDTERKYNSAKLECACVIWIVRKLEALSVLCPHTPAITGSYGLQFLDEKATEPILVQKRVCELEGFRFPVHYRRGALNIADYLSRQYDQSAIVAGSRLKRRKKRLG